MIFILRRFLVTIPVLFGVSTLTFLLIHFVPGDPVDAMLGENASLQDKESLRHELGLDQPLVDQYADFLNGVVHLELGRSLITRRPVISEILERIPATLELTFT